MDLKEAVEARGNLLDANHRSHLNLRILFETFFRCREYLASIRKKSFLSLVSAMLVALEQ